MFSWQTDNFLASLFNLALALLVWGNPEKYKELLEVITEFRDDELEHMDTGIEYEGEKAPAYELLKTVIQTGCKGAIWLSEKI